KFFHQMALAYDVEPPTLNCMALPSSEGEPTAYIECGVEGPVPPAPAQREQVCQPLAEMLVYVCPKASEPARQKSARQRMGNSFFMIAKTSMNKNGTTF